MQQSVETQVNIRPTYHKKSQTTLKPKQFSQGLCDALSIAGKMLFICRYSD